MFLVLNILQTNISRLLVPLSFDIPAVPFQATTRGRLKFVDVGGVGLTIVLLGEKFVPGLKLSLIIFDRGGGGGVGDSDGEKLSITCSRTGDAIGFGAGGGGKVFELLKDVVLDSATVSRLGAGLGTSGGAGADCCAVTSGGRDKAGKEILIGAGAGRAAGSVDRRCRFCSGTINSESGLGLLRLMTGCTGTGFFQRSSSLVYGFVRYWPFDLNVSLPLPLC